MEFSSKQPGLTDRSPGFEPCQIVCLEYDTSRLYGEVVQIVEPRQVCWMRPLMLAVATFAGEESIDTEPYFYDLRQGADLLLPIVLFRTVLDVEVIPLFTHLYSQKGAGNSLQSTGHQLLQQLIQTIWSAHPELFRHEQGAG